MPRQLPAIVISITTAFMLAACMKNVDETADNNVVITTIQNSKVSGWSLMSKQERSVIRQRLLTIKSYDECTVFLEQHYLKMLERAQEDGLTTPINRTDLCVRMQSAGMFR